MMTFEVYADRAGAWRWRVRSHNGQIVGGSQESFDSKQNAGRAASTLLHGVRNSFIPPRIVYVEE